MPLLSEYVRRKKIRYFLEPIPKQARILKVGSGSGWVHDCLKGHGWTHYTGIDLKPPADVVGDIRRWADLGLQPRSFDVIIALEVVEHVDCLSDCYELLHPGGSMLLTTPVPCMDWALKLLERIGLNLKRTSPYDRLAWVSRIPCFEHKNIRIVGLMAQGAVLRRESE